MVRPADGSKLLAAMKFIFPARSRLGHWSLPRSHRALSSWSKLQPGRQRLPLLWVVLFAMLGWLCQQGQHVVALNLLFQFRTYLRRESEATYRADTRRRYCVPSLDHKPGTYGGVCPRQNRLVRRVHQVRHGDLDASIFR